MKKIIPFGNRILVKRDIVGDTIGKDNIIHVSDNLKESLTDMATVMYVPDHTFIDSVLLSGAEEMVASLSLKVKKDGDSQSMMSLLRFNDYCRVKSLKVGDRILCSKHVGVTFNDNFHEGELTLLDSEDVIGVIHE